jgi:hypothetical protein
MRSGAELTDRPRTLYQEERETGEPDDDKLVALTSAGAL